MTGSTVRGAFTDELTRLAQMDRTLFALATDSRGSVTLGDFAALLPGQFIECGIAEQDAVGMAAGLANAGLRPFVCGPACFYSMRSAEQIKVDVAYSRTNVKIIGVSGGVSYDPLGLVEAWQINEAGNDLVHAQVGAEKQYSTLNERQFAVIAPCGLVGDCSTYTYYAKNVVAGLDFNLAYDEYDDCITGKKVTLTNKSGYKEKYDNSVDAYYRLNRYYAWINNLTTVRISMLYCTAEESERITDIQSVLDSYIRENFAKFVTGGRSLDEFDAYQEELKQLGIEELLDIYQRGYEPYIDSVFN